MARICQPRRPAGNLAVPGTRRRAACAGFTLVEGVFATFVLVLGFGAAAMMLNMAVRATMTAQAQMTALHRMREAIETVKTFGFDEAGMDYATHALPMADVDGFYRVAEPEGDDAGNDRLKRLEFAITYHNMSTGEDEQMLLTSMECSPLE